MVGEGVPDLTSVLDGAGYQVVVAANDDDATARLLSRNQAPISVVVIRFDYDDYRLTWETRYISSVQQDPDGVDEFGTAFDISDTCLGPPDDVLCRDYGDTENYFLHNLSFYYYGDQWTIGGGIRNVFNDKPPVVDGTEVFSVNNTPIGYGYDLNGRVYFVNVGFNFVGE